MIKYRVLSVLSFIVNGVGIGLAAKWPHNPLSILICMSACVTLSLANYNQGKFDVKVAYGIPTK